MTKINLYIYAICSGPEVAADVTSGWYIKTVKGYTVVHFEVPSWSSLWENKNIKISILLW